jgi:hypothetical protein
MVSANCGPIHFFLLPIPIVGALKLANSAECDRHGRIHWHVFETIRTRKVEIVPLPVRSRSA